MKTLTLHDCIRKLNPLQLRSITERYGIVLIPFSSRNAREALLAALTAESATATFEQYTPLQKTALMVLDMLSDYAPAQVINGVIENISENSEQAKELFEFLLSTGVVYLLQIGADNIYRYAIPEELRDAVKSFAQNQFMEKIKRHEQPVSQEFHEHMSFELSMLAMLIDTIKNDVRLNIDNTLGKRVVNRLTPYLGLPADSFDETVIDKYTNTIFAHLNDMALISKEHHVHVHAVEQWLDLPAGKRRELFFDFLLYGKQTPFNFQYFAYALSYIPEDTWVSIDILFRVVQLFFGEKKNSLEQFSAHPFSSFPVMLLYVSGIVSFATQDLHHFSAWRITPFGKTLLEGGSQPDIIHQTDNHIIIQPNFEFMISRYADIKLLWLVYRFADLVQCEQLLRFHISRDSIYRGMASGVRKDEIIAVLERNAKGSVSQNVIYSIQEWCEEYGAVYFMDVFLMRCKSKHIAEHIQMHPRTKDYIKGSMSDTDLIVRRCDAQELIDLLKTLGFMPLEHIVRPEEDPMQPPGMAKRHRSKKFHERNTVSFDYTDVKILSEISELT